MRIYRYERNKKADGRRVVALGFFDGVHIGHRALLLAARQAAEKRGIPFAVFTFGAEEFGIKGAARLYSTEEKLSLIEECGIDEVILADFDAVKSITAENFIEKTLAR